MAKSLRSKWKRKMKALKRERYGKKELEKLKSIIENSKEDSEDVDMLDLITVVPRPISSQVEVAEDEKMEDDSKKVKIYNQSTMKDQFGNYPVWMSSHRKKKMKKAMKRLNKNKKNKKNQ